jgi:hypothetical protein
MRILLDINVIAARAKALKLPMRELCRHARVSHSTVCRHKNDASAKGRISTYVKLTVALHQIALERRG